MAVRFQAARVRLMAVVAGLAVGSMAAAVPVAAASAAVVPGAHRVGGSAAIPVRVHRADSTVPTDVGVNQAIPDAHQWDTPSWAGWVDVAGQNVALRYVTANFIVPKVTCHGQGQLAYFWVGLDGFGGATVEQVGVGAVCDISTPNGYQPSYFSWWEMYHKGDSGPHKKGTVKPGDGIAASVYYDSSTGDWNLALNDSNSTTPDIKKAEPCPTGYTCPNETAEVIAEDPGGAVPHGVYLAEFDTVHFSEVGVTSRDGTKGTLYGNSLWSANESTMTSNGRPNGDLMAQPSDRTDGGTAFSVTWYASS